MNRITNVLLWAGAAGWGISILGILLPWDTLHTILLNLGMKTQLTDPQLQYWIRMATGSWSIIGFFFLMTALRPARYSNLIPLLAAGSIFEGALLLFHGLMLSRPLFPFSCDTAFCLLIGIGLLASHSRKSGENSTSSVNR